jgi:hypothetical protein
VLAVEGGGVLGADEDEDGDGDGEEEDGDADGDGEEDAVGDGDPDRDPDGDGDGDLLGAADPDEGGTATTTDANAYGLTNPDTGGP